MKASIIAIAIVMAPIGPDPDAVLACIRQVEGVTNPARRGPAGELGFYRITPEVWAENTKQPFRLCATDPYLEIAVARKHIRRLAQGIQAAGETVTPYRLALAWNAGLSATVDDTAPRRARDYARRVVNLLP